MNYAFTESSDTSYPGINLPITDSYTITDIKTYANVTHPNIGQVNILFWFPWSTGLNTAVWYNQTTCTNANMDKWFDLAGSAPDCSTVDGSPFLPFSTGNFNENSAKIYTDVTLFTSNNEILKDAAKIFDFFDVNYRVHRYKHLIVSPHYTRSRFNKLIEREILN